MQLRPHLCREISLGTASLACATGYALFKYAAEGKESVELEYSVTSTNDATR